MQAGFECPVNWIVLLDSLDTATLFPAQTVQVSWSMLEQTFVNLEGYFESRGCDNAGWNEVVFFGLQQLAEVFRLWRYLVLHVYWALFRRFLVLNSIEMKCYSIIRSLKRPGHLLTSGAWGHWAPILTGTKSLSPWFSKFWGDFYLTTFSSDSHIPLSETMPWLRYFIKRYLLGPVVTKVGRQRTWRKNCLRNIMYVRRC